MPLYNVAENVNNLQDKTSTAGNRRKGNNATIWTNYIRRLKDEAIHFEEANARIIRLEHKTANIKAKLEFISTS